MKNKRILFVVLTLVMLAVFYLISLGIYLSYQNTVKSETQMALELPSTDLSGLSFSDYTVGEETSILPYDGWEDEEISLMTLTFADGISQTLWLCYYTGGIVNSRLTEISTGLYPSDNVIAAYNGESIPNQTHLKDFFGDSYIEIPARGGNAPLLIYMDHENDRKLTLSMSSFSGDNWHVRFEEFRIDSDYIYDPESNTSVWITGYNPIWVSYWGLSKLTFGYTIFEPRNYGFTNGELVSLPIYYAILFLPVIALIVFRRRKLFVLNIALGSFYVVWLVAVFMRISQY